MKQLLMFAILAITVSLAPSVFAAQPYIAVAPDISSESISQAWFFSDYDGIHDSLHWIGSVLSSAGASSGSTPNNVVYQIGSLVQTNEDLDARAEVWNPSGTLHTCNSWVGGCPELASDIDLNDYVYSTMYWNGADTVVTFYWDSKPVSGVTTSYSGTYTPNRTYDSSIDFLVGKNTAPAYDLHYLQVGMESDDEVTSTSLDQKDIGWTENVGGVTYGKNKAFRTIEHPAHSTHSVYIAYPNPSYMAVGGLEYDNASGDYIKKIGSSVIDGAIEYSMNSSDDLARNVLVWD